MSSDNVKLLGEVWSRQKVMDNSGIVQKKVLRAVFERKIDRPKNLFWNGCCGNILYNICVKNYFFVANIVLYCIFLYPHDGIECQ